MIFFVSLECLLSEKSLEFNVVVGYNLSKYNSLELKLE